MVAAVFRLVTPHLLAMKTSLLCCLLAAALFAWPACSNNDAECDTDLALDEVQPSANPPGYEVLLVGEGFTANTTVRFDNEESPDVTFVSATELIAKIPSGLLGSVEVTVEEGDCVGRNAEFEVFGSFPNNVPVSPATIFVNAAPPTTFPDNFQNAWQNIADIEHIIFITGVDAVGNIVPKDGNFPAEFHSGGNQFLNNNPASGYIRVNTTAKTSDIRVVVDRSAKPGGTVEAYTGQFVLPNSVGSTKPYAMLLQSEKDGRQLILEPN